jgi:hypothetical protein
MWWVWMLVGMQIGVVCGYLLAALMIGSAQDRRSVERQRKRALLGLPDRPPRRPGAQGAARVTTADYRPRKWRDSDDF